MAKEEKWQNMSKEELMREADKRGIDVDREMGTDEIRSAIMQHEKQRGTATQ